MRHGNPTVGEQPTTAKETQNDESAAEQTDSGVRESPFGIPGTEATESVVSSANGGHFHKTLGDSDIPRCGARCGAEPMERMTLYRAVEETDLDRCTRCPW